MNNENVVIDLRAKVPCEHWVGRRENWDAEEPISEERLREECTLCGGTSRTPVIDALAWSGTPADILEDIGITVII